MAGEMLCDSDEEALMGFLQRAVPVILISGFLPPTLGVLDSFEKNGAGWTERNRAERPVLARLADEFFGEFKSQAIPNPVTFKSLKAALSHMIGGDDDGRIVFDFRTFARLETEYWSFPDTPLHNVPVFGLYMVRDGGDGFGWFLENIFCYSDDDAPKNEYGQSPAEAYLDNHSVIYDNGGEVGTQFSRCEFDDIQAMNNDPRFCKAVPFQGNICDADLRNVDQGYLASAVAGNHGAREVICEGIKDAVEAELRDEALEYFGGNAHHPLVVLNT